MNTSVPRALKRLCLKHRASAEAEVRRNALHTATTNLGNGGGVQKYGLGFAKLFSGDMDFAKPRLIFKKGFLELVSAPQEGSGEECGADSFLIFGGRAFLKN